MEAGSLLQEALSRQVEQDGIFDSDQALWLDVYLLPDDGNTNNKTKDSAAQQQQHLVQLAQLACQLNDFFQSQKYPWHIGGDGPVFAIHTSDSNSSSNNNNKIPHLRAICRYGANVADEWMAVHILMQFTASQEKQQDHQKNLAAEVVDLQDGQILLIESADILPSWVDQVGPENCRHRCWIRNGKIHLIAPTIKVNQPHQNQNLSLELSEALEILNPHIDRSSTNNILTTPENVQKTIQQCISRLVALAPDPSVASPDGEIASNNLLQNSCYHKAALAVPRAVAHLFERRPDLVNAAIVAFANLAHQDQQQQPTSMKQSRKSPENQGKESSSSKIVCEDWVWTTRSFSRTNFAMLRTILSPTWNSEDYIPPKCKSVELRRIQRQCKVEATPHLRNALQLGVRLVAGLEALLQQSSASSPAQSTPPLSLKEQRVLQWWSRISQEVNLSSQWLMDAWQAGPNRAVVDMESILRCPVFYEELELNPENITPLSQPETPLKQQIMEELKREQRFEKEFVMPRQEEVDINEDWMTLSMDHADEQMSTIRGEKTSQQEKQVEPTTNNETAQLDTILDSFKTFMVDKSDVEGVAHKHKDEKTAGKGVRINPRVFLNLLQTVLDPSTSPESIQFGTATPNGAQDDDDFFSKEDYEDMLPDDDDSDDNDNGMLDTDVVELMNAMDHELKGTAAMESNSNDVLDQDGIQISEVDNEVEEHARVLTNLLQSLESGAGGPSPVQSMLRAMGQEPPLLSPHILDQEELSDE